MARLYLRFAKRGYIRYTSHLDLLRLFKRAFKRTGVPLAYSQGYNPHPKMSFAQPLSLGYTAEQEFLEFYTYEDMPAEELLARMAPALPAVTMPPFSQSFRWKASGCCRTNTSSA